MRHLAKREEALAEPARAPDFFVGYLKTPLRLVRFLAVTISLLLLLVDGVALIAYRLQEARPSGDWGDTGAAAYDGVLRVRPYPIVLVPAIGHAAAHVVLLVSDGKAGAPPGLAALDGKRVTVAGYPLFRDGITVLQLDRPPRALPGATPPPSVATELGPRTLTGEIVDSKCFLGAMNPGEGKVHEACASLCLIGGIPPLFVTADTAGHLTYRLLADDSGAAMPDAAAAHAGQSLTLTGKITRLEGIDLFAVPRAELD
jgi:hypothetical protein